MKLEEVTLVVVQVADNQSVMIMIERLDVAAVLLLLLQRIPTVLIAC